MWKYILFVSNVVLLSSPICGTQNRIASLTPMCVQFLWPCLSKDVYLYCTNSEVRTKQSKTIQYIISFRQFYSYLLRKLLFILQIYVTQQILSEDQNHCLSAGTENPLKCVISWMRNAKATDCLFISGENNQSNELSSFSSLMMYGEARREMQH